MAAIARQSAPRFAQPAAPPCVLLSAGSETTVQVRGNGRGGRNSEFLLALALDGHPQVYAIAYDTDGIDGSENNAGALIDQGTLARARNARAALDANGFFAAAGGLITTGPTLTNVNDFRVVLVLPPRSPRPLSVPVP
ncbi:MAG: hydroxypyruvate reductase [Rhodospirillaceae bacterium]|nr:MAG: hydroxypyruvate reductase [Rhodospirillaceae bacterium]